jgi:hypothetical protein
MEKAFIKILTHDMKVSSKMIKEMELVYVIILMGVYMMDLGKMDCSMGEDYSHLDVE